MTLGRTLLLAAVAFALNWTWEMAHMGAYVGMAEQPWRATAVRCARASAADAALVVALSVLSLRWTRGAAVWPAAAVLGLAAGSLIEWWGLSSGRWTYERGMPVVPWLEVGLSPLLQLAILTPVSLWLSGWRSRRPPH